LAEEQEKNRIRITKELALAKKRMEEDQQKIDMDRQRREKKEFEDAKRRMLEQLERDKQERFGKSGATGLPTGGTVPTQAAPKKMEPIEQVKHGLKTVRTLYTEDRQPGLAKTCFKTISVYLTNILKNPTEEKYRKINLTNDAFQKRVGKINGALSILKGAGFEDAPDDTLILHNLDEQVVKEALRLLENNL
jgi:hypothetical protein